MSVQVSKEHYYTWSYNHKARWLTYFHQLQLLRKYECHRVCEVGPGHGWMKLVARDLGVDVTTVDFDSALKPDVVASIDALPFDNESFDAACAFEVLEHMPFERFEHNVRALARIARQYVFISLPDHRRILFHIKFKLPFLPYNEFMVKIPSGKTHVFDGQHYWEIGKRGYTPKHVVRVCLNTGLKLVETFVPPDTPSNFYIVLKKR